MKASTSLGSLAAIFATTLVMACGDDGATGGAGGTAQTSTSTSSTKTSSSATKSSSGSGTSNASSTSNASATATTDASATATTDASATATTDASASTTAVASSTATASGSTASATASATATTAASTGASSGTGGLLPDLTVNQAVLAADLSFDIVDSESDPCLVGEKCLGGNGPRLVVRFSTRTENIGPVDFVIGDPENSPGFVFSPCHGHYHYYDYASYRVLDAAGNVAAVGHKQGFAVIDIGPIDPNDPNTPPFGMYNGSYQGITRGWYDEYGAGLQCQWIDITGVPPGDYFLEVEVNPSQTFVESTYANNAVQVPLHIPECPMGCAHLDTDCTTGSCVAGVGCQALPINDGLGCDDHLFCTVDETCSGGVCGGGSPRDCAPPGGCFVGSCDDASASCVVTPGNEGLACDDGSPCTDGTTCTAGSCSGGVPVNDGASCQDDAACTSGEVCAAGECGGGVGPTIFFADDFSNNAAGWTLGPTWQVGPAVPTTGADIGGDDPANDHSPTSDNGIGGVVLGGFAPAQLHDYYYLESPTFDTTSAGNVTFGYYRWLSTDFPAWMRAKVEVYNGTSWVTLWSSEGQGGSVVDHAWTYQSFNISAYKSAQTKIRFGYDIRQVNQLYMLGGWNVDDVIVSSSACP